MGETDTGDLFWKEAEGGVRGVRGGDRFDDRVMLRRSIMSCSLLAVLTGAGESGRASVLQPPDDEASVVLPSVAFVSSLWFSEATCPFVSAVASVAGFFLPKHFKNFNHMKKFAASRAKQIQ